MKALGQQMTSKELHWVMSGMDFDGDGVVDFVEFLLLILHNVGRRIFSFSLAKV